MEQLMNQHPMRAIARALPAVLIMAWVHVAGLSIANAQATSSTAGRDSRAGITVTVVHPESTSLQTSLSANGSITAWQEAAVSVEVGGLRLTELNVNVGDHVQKNDVLAVFATEPLEADLAVLRAQISEATAALAEAKSNAARAKGLQNSGALSSQQIGQYLTAEQTAKARLGAIDAQAKVLELRLLKSRVLAPDDGEIISRQATLGAVIPTGAELYRILRQSRLEWRAEVTASELGQIKPGMQVHVFPASLAQGAAPVVGRVRIIGPTVDPQSRTAIVYVDLPSTGGQGSTLRAGMFAKGEFILGNNTGLTLPQEAIVTRDGFNYVFIVHPDKHVTKTKVEIGQRLGQRVEVLRGVQPGDEIANAGAGFLADGDIVNITDALPPSEPKK
jgi:RND family efflux transporter MFP subunit